MTFEGPLLFAFNAVGLAFIFFSHSDPPFRPLLKPREPPAASARTGARYPRVAPSGGDFTLSYAEISLTLGDLGVMSEFGRYLC